MKPLKIIFISFLLLFSQSCSKDVDFDQIDEATIYATYITTLAHLDLVAIDFLDESNQEMVITQDAIAAPISDASKDFLEKIEFTVITENSFSRDFYFDVIFYNENQEPIYQLQPTVFVPANSGETTTIIEIPKNDVGVIFNTTYFGFYLVLAPSSDGSVINPSTTGNFKLKSSAKLFLNYKKV